MDYIANVENSEIDVSGIRTVLVQGDSSYPIIRFVLDPALTGLSWRVRGTYTGTNIAVLSPEITAVESGTEITLDWSVSADFTTYDGDMQLVLVGSNNTGTIVIKALAEITVQKDWSIGTTGTITLDLFEQLMAQAYADGSVTNVKLANMENNTIKGNVSGSDAAPSDLTVAQVRGIITEGTSEVDSIADGDKIVIEDVSATAGVRTKHVLWSAIKTALRSIFMPYDAASTNLLINGGFDIWQRGTSFSAAGYTADRWLIGFNGSGLTTAITQQTFTVGQTDVPNNPTYYLRFARSVAGSGNTYNVLSQAVESVALLAGKTVTLSFYAKAASSINVTTYCSQYFGSGGSSSVYLDAQNNAITTSWVKFTQTISIPLISGKTVGAGSYLSVQFALPVNTTFTFDFANVQLNYGSVALPFVPRVTGLEPILTGRFYENSYNEGVAVGTATQGGCNSTVASTGYILARMNVAFAFLKRIAPTVLIYSTYDGAVGYAAEYNVGGVFVANRAVTVSVGANKSFLIQSTNGDLTIGNIIRFHYSADSEL